MKKLIKYYLLLFFALPSFAQMPNDTIRDFVIQGNLDTIEITRSYNKWFFGVNGGVNLNQYFGDLNLSEIPNFDDIMLKYQSGNGYGYYLGLVGEYAEPGKFWGYGVRLNLYDYRVGFAETDQFETLESEYDYKYEVEPLLKMISFSPYVRYSMPIEGLYFNGGLDVELYWDAIYRQRKNFINTGEIDQWDMPQELPDITPRVGIFAGVGYDFLMASISNRVRLIFSPYISFHTATPIVWNSSSAWNQINTRLGLAIKITFDHQQRKFLPYDSTYNPPAGYIAMGNTERGIDIALAGTANKPVSEGIKYVPPQPEPEPEPKDPTIDEPDTQGPTLATGINPNKIKVFNYRSSTTTSLSRSQRSYLNELAKFLKANPNYRIRIVGYSDDSGTLTQNTERSRKRAENVFNYLLGQGISRRRLLAAFKGSLDNVADNSTPEGRRKNRRVEITFIR